MPARANRATDAATARTSSRRIDKSRYAARIGYTDRMSDDLPGQRPYEQPSQLPSGRDNTGWQIMICVAIIAVLILGFLLAWIL